jgi:hypothetical protein
MEKIKTEQPEKQMHSIRYVSAVTGKCYRTIHNAIKSGRIKAIRLGGSVMVPDGELRRICERGF